MFWQIAEQPEQREFWLHRQAMEEFLRYVRELNIEESRIAPDATSPFRRLLRQVPGGYEHVECLNDSRIHLNRDRSTVELIYSLIIVYWSGKIPNEGVVDAVPQSLENEGWLNPIKINKSAAQPANLVELIRSSRSAIAEKLCQRFTFATTRWTVSDPVRSSAKPSRWHELQKAGLAL
jgi:hypothetical protein